MWFSALIRCRMIVVCSCKNRVLYWTCEFGRGFICLHFYFSGIFKGFLDEVMKKYGSLVPLCEKDVMGRLKEVFNEDFSHRCVAVLNSRLYKLLTLLLHAPRLTPSTTEVCLTWPWLFIFLLLPSQSCFRKPFITREIMKYREKHPKPSTCNFRVFYNKHMLDMDDLATLDGQNWLNDQVRAAAVYVLPYLCF